MNKYLAYVRGLFLPLGYEEFFACMEAENSDYEIEFFDNQIILFECAGKPEKAASRCAFLHSLLKIVAKGDVDEAISITDEYNLDEIEKNKSFCVRANRIGTKQTKVSRVDIERELGSYIYTRFENRNLSVNLKEPDYRFYTIIHKNTFYLGLEQWSMDRDTYRKREPSKRPSFRPGSMKTDFARALVNLSRVREGDIFYDPFCGGGGFLIESSILGAYSLGSDISAEAVLGAASNLRKFSEGEFAIIRSDSRQSVIRRTDAIATDPPYSIQSSTHGEQIKDLLFDFLRKSKTILEPGRFLVFSSPKKINPEEIVKQVGFDIVSIIDARIHKSLTRRIIVAK
jgi:tRNA (guanine10-N2)-dimethyltransferase